jgi:two-component system chemotaxis response regulator CheB
MFAEYAQENADSFGAAELRRDRHVRGRHCGALADLQRPGAGFPGRHPHRVAHPGASSDDLVGRPVGVFGSPSVKVAEAGEVIRQGTAYIAPAGTHLLAKGKRIELGMGPAEQRARPAIDALFRSAATNFGQRVIGVVLTGMLRDGTLGLRAVRDARGITVVQDPEEAEAAEMPRSAMQGLSVDYCLELSETGPLLDLLVRRAGRTKRGVLETGLASSVRLMKDRLRLLTKLNEQSQGNRKTARFIQAEIAALDREIASIHKLIPRAAINAQRASEKNARR